MSLVLFDPRSHFSSPPPPQRKLCNHGDTWWTPRYLLHTPNSKSRLLYRWVKPFADWYAQVASYRQMGFKYDDLLIEERDDVQKACHDNVTIMTSSRFVWALGRLAERDAYDLNYCFRIALQTSLLYRNLPKEQWVKPDDDVHYLRPHVENVWAEDLERAKWDNVQVRRKR